MDYSFSPPWKERDTNIYKNLVYYLFSVQKYLCLFSTQVSRGKTTGINYIMYPLYHFQQTELQVWPILNLYALKNKIFLQYSEQTNKHYLYLKLFTGVIKNFKKKYTISKFLLLTKIDKNKIYNRYRVQCHFTRVFCSVASFSFGVKMHWHVQGKINAIMLLLKHNCVLWCLRECLQKKCLRFK